MKNRSVLFMLPNASAHPVGGYKVVYEYANRLCSEGYRVKIVYGVAGRPVRNPMMRLAYKFLRLFRYLKFRLFGSWKPHWFDLDQRIEHFLRYDFTWHRMPKADLYVATAWSTAPALAAYRAVDPNRKFYLIQSFEDWATSKQEVEDTWRLPLRKIVIAPWLLDIAHQLGQEAVLIENGLDQQYFTLNRAIEDRGHTVSMLYHTSPLKGCADGLAAIEAVKQKIPDLQATLFGVPPRAEGLPTWIQYVRQPNREQHNKIYNDSAVFIAPSHLEGFGLTAAEAMLCGATVCASSNGGHLVFCHDRQTALLSPVADSEAMARNLMELLENEPLRIELAQNALANIKQYTWQRAYNQFEALLRTAH